MAHGDLGRHSVVVDEAGSPWLVDFDHAASVAPERRRQADLVELAVSLAVRFGAERALTGAAAAVGGGPVAAALTATDPKALTATTREELGDRPGLREELTRLAEAGPAVRRRSSDPSR
jgi:undecaprenyl-diphosphatase